MHCSGIIDILHVMILEFRRKTNAKKGDDDHYLTISVDLISVSMMMMMISYLTHRKKNQYVRVLFIEGEKSNRFK